MKKTIAILLACLMVGALFVGCGTQTEEPTTQLPPQTTAPTEIKSTEEITEEATEEVDEEFGYNKFLYAAQIERYYLALSEGWDEATCIENGISSLVPNYYAGDALENIGFTFIDFDNDGTMELVIGAIENADEDPTVLEIWTMKNDEAVSLAQSNARSKYYLQYDSEVGNWSIGYEANNSADNYCVLFMMITEGELVVTQGITYDAAANAENPWFMTYDADWDVTNDEPTDEVMANAVIETGRFIYVVAEYTPYSAY